MIGAGVFSAFAPAAAAAGSGLLVGLALAAGVAYCNAVASAQLAAQYPTSGGTYVYGRERLGEWWGFLAGWGFVIGKTASCAAMALTFAAYATAGSLWAQRVVARRRSGGADRRQLPRHHPDGRARPRARGGLARRSDVVVVAIAAGGHGARCLGGSPFGDGGLYGILQSAGLLFFAFAGYARIATLGEEVRDPERTIPRAIPLALGITVVVYAAVGTAALSAAGPGGARREPGAGRDRASRRGCRLGEPGRARRCGGGEPRLTACADRGRRQDDARHGAERRPPRLARVGASPPPRAGSRGARGGCRRLLLVLTTDLRGAIGFSSFGVLAYYAVANAAAYTQDAEHRRWPRWLNVAGALACVVLVASLPWRSAVAGALVLAVGLAARLVRLAALPQRDQ